MFPNRGTPSHSSMITFYCMQYSYGQKYSRDPGALEMFGGLRCVNPVLGAGDYRVLQLSRSNSSCSFLFL